ncbi:hypothetical protein [Streptomyces sp. NPDC096152]|uniref:hypothetical protein n=1 Tax=Streptomyces sp. NPDC096152 TaxID=3366078 RepID=UPI00380C8E9F
MPEEAEKAEAAAGEGDGEAAGAAGGARVPRGRSRGTAVLVAAAAALGLAAGTCVGAQTAVHDDAFPDAAAVDGIARTVYVEPRPYGTEQVRQAYLSAGDTVAVITQSRKGGAPAVPFQQTVTLQSELLG